MVDLCVRLRACQQLDLVANCLTLPRRAVCALCAVPCCACSHPPTILQTLKVLVDGGANIELPAIAPCNAGATNHAGLTPILSAAYNGDMDIVEILIGGFKLRVGACSAALCCLCHAWLLPRPWSRRLQWWPSKARPAPGCLSQGQLYGALLTDARALGSPARAVLPHAQLRAPTSPSATRALRWAPTLLCSWQP